MELPNITFFAFQEKYGKVHRQLVDPEQYKAILDEARRELPIVDGLLGLLNEVKAMPEDQQSATFNRIMQDVHMVITLWSMMRTSARHELEPESKPVTPPAEDHQLRLRRFGMN